MTHCSPCVGPIPWEQRYRVRLFLLLMVSVAPLPSHAETDTANHADLNTICFVGDHAWAAGDRGVIWHSDDLGATWHRQMNPEVASIRQLFFLDNQHGWAIGYTVDTLGHGRGVLWQTEDGGHQWVIRPVPLMSQMYGLAMLNPSEGWAWGVPSPHALSGVYRTRDGGRNWSSLPGLAPTAWTAGHLDPQGRLFLSGTGAAAAWVDRTNLALGTSQGYPTNAARCRSNLVLPLAQNLGWRIGRDFGNTETFSPQGWISHPRFPCHLLSGAANGTRLWMAGDPGDRIFLSSDQGKNWEQVLLDWRLPIRSMAFATPEIGCFVSPLGNIHRTQDGGRTWKRVLGTHDRVAVLALVPRSIDVPWELLADAASIDYLSRALVWGNAEDPLENEADALHLASLQAGATGGELGQRWGVPATREPIPWKAAQERVAITNESNDRLERLAHGLAQAILTWHPQAIVTVTSDQPTGLASVTEQAVRLAQQWAAAGKVWGMAADGEIRRAPWKVTEIWAEDATIEPRYALRVSRQQIRPVFGDTIGGAANTARRMVGDRPDDNPNREIVTYRRLFPPAAANAGVYRLLQGAEWARGTPGRLAAPALTLGDPREWQERLAAQRNAHAVLSQLVQQFDAPRPNHPPVQLAAWDRMLQAAEPLSPLDSGEFLYRLGAEYHRHGATSLAVETMRGLVRSGDQHGVQRAALQWLWDWETSAEAQYRWLADQRNPSSTKPRELHSPTGVPWPKQLIQLMRQRFPASESEPPIQLPYIAWQREQDATQATTLLQGLTVPSGSPWTVPIAVERWQLTQRGECPIPIRTLSLTPARPKLDGKFDEDLWKSAAVVPLVGLPPASSSVPAHVLLAGDEQYLFLGVDCQRWPDLAYPPADQGRSRDPNLSQSDRVEIRFDTNRDYVSAWKLTLDYRGWTQESLLGDKTWNPTWAVAADQDGEHWRVEAAIAWKELAPEVPRHPWVISVTRILPHRDRMMNQPVLTLDREARGLNLLQIR